MLNQSKAQTINFSDKIMIMGILNVTPDSFSDGGQFVTDDNIIGHADQMVLSGADIIDIGGQSTRPFSQPVSIDEELRRVIPAITAIRRKHSIPISIDTTKAEVARQAIEAGADIVNDISALIFDPEMINVVKMYHVPIVIMHMQGTPGNMQDNPEYENVISETIDFFKDRIEWLQEQGVNREQIIVDPGIGFGKSAGHNLSIIKHLHKYKTLDCPVLVGHSRKSFIGSVLKDKVTDRDEVTAAISSILAFQGASIIRVHNVPINSKAIKISQAIMAAD